jgi:hypothetical protein
VERPLSLRSRRRLELVAVVAAAFAFAWPMQGGGSLQHAHYALVKAFAAGTAAIDEGLREIEGATNDMMLRDGHLYSNKAPGLAAVSLPAYLVLRELGAAVEGDTTRILWALGLAGVVVPGLALLLLVRRVAERFEPGFGTAAAVMLGVATLLLPFATLFLSHVLSAFLVFAAFALLVEERAGERRPYLIGAAGLVSGLAVVVEYPNALAVAILGLYALARGPAVTRAVLYGAGALAGAAPMLAYNAWAFGGPFTTSYSTDSSGRATSLWGSPDVDVLLQLFLSQQGLLVGSPVLACALAGTVLLVRRGWRAEALVIGAVTLGFALLSSAFYSPFGGFSPGPRYLIVALPFLAVGLAPAARAAPLVTGALATVSAAAMTLLTVTHPLAGYDGAWAERLLAGDISLTAASFGGVTGRLALVPLLLAVLAAGLLAMLLSGPARVGRLEPLLAGSAVVAWAGLAAAAPEGRSSGVLLLALLGMLAAAGAWAVLAQRQPGRLREGPALR